MGSSKIKNIKIHRIQIKPPVYSELEKYRISNRKIKKFVSMNSIRNKNNIFLEAQNFRKEFLNEFLKYDQNYVINADQTGFTYQMAPKRTLFYTGKYI